MLTNTGIGGFVAASTNTTSGPGSGNVQMVVAADINADAMPDLITANGGTTGILSVFTNNGSGGFALASNYSVGNNPFAVAAADVNGDSFPDLISANNNSSGTLSVLLNNGSGVFAPAIHYVTGDSPRSVVATDVNGDNNLDLISANIGGNSLSVLLNNGSGALLAPLPFSAGNAPVWVTATDLNGDGDVDLICANNTAPGTLTAVTNNGSGFFLPAFTASVGNLPYAVIAADVNADGRVDLVSVNGTSPGTLSVLFNRPSFNGTFVGNGSGLTNLNVDASTIVAGTLAEARIDSAVARDSEILPTVLAGDGAGSGLDADLLDGLDASAFWNTGGNTGTAPGPHFLGTTDNQALELKVNGMRALRLEPNAFGAPNMIGGAPNNFAAPGVVGATIGGGGATNFFASSSWTNKVLGFFGTVGGGLRNTSDSYATVGGGSENASSGLYATVGGGEGNTSSGSRATVPGGSQNVAAGDYSFAAGYRAWATNAGAFVWGDSTPTDISSTNNNSWTVRASGGVRFFSSADATAGVFLAPNGTSWSAISDRNAKKNFHPVDVQAVLEKLARLPLQQWNYNWEADNEVPHLGPMAQDFKGAFYPGRDDKSITTQELDGVALAAIQGLNEKTEIRNQKSEERIQKLETENAQLKTRLEMIEQLLTHKLNGRAK